MSYYLIVTLAFGVGALLAQAESSQAVPVAKEPAHHEVLANQFVRVYHVKLAPHASTLVHIHDHDYIGVNLTTADLTNTPVGGQPKAMHVEPGVAQLIKAPLTHAVANLGDSRYENITVSLLKNSPQHPPGAVPEGNFGGEGVTTRMLFENDIVRAWDIEIAPGGTQTHHVHQLPYLAIAITDVNFKNVPDKGSQDTISVKAGEVAWRNPPYGHTLTNVSDQPARFISLEFK